jgi:hypothetical protein
VLGRSAKAPETMGPRVEHGDRLTPRVGGCQVLCNAKTQAAFAQEVVQIGNQHPHLCRKGRGKDGPPTEVEEVRSKSPPLRLRSGQALAAKDAARMGPPSTSLAETKSESPPSRTRREKGGAPFYNRHIQGALRRICGGLGYG